MLTGGSAFAERLAAWQQKALREAKLATDWAAAERGLRGGGARPSRRAGRTKRSCPTCWTTSWPSRSASRRPARSTAWRRRLLKLTVPGVPDIYQGTEFWDFSLVDPDNRRPVDFAARAGRARCRAARRSGGALARRPHQAGADRARRSRCGASGPRLFAEGSYEPLAVRGDMRRSRRRVRAPARTRDRDHGRAAHRIAPACDKDEIRLRVRRPGRTRRSTLDARRHVRRSCSSGDDISRQRTNRNRRNCSNRLPRFAADRRHADH